MDDAAEAVPRQAGYRRENPDKAKLNRQRGHRQVVVEQVENGFHEDSLHFQGEVGLRPP